MSLTLAQFVKSSPHLEPDLDDLAAASRGNREAFRRLVHRTRNLVSAVALSVVKDVAASEDVSQEVFLHAWSGLSQLRSLESFLPWLRQLARNKANDHLRARYRRAALVEPAEPHLVSEHPSPAPTQAETLEDREDLVRLAEAIDALPESTRETVLLFYREGQSIAQVALLLGLSEEAVKKRLSRARETLREALLEEVTQTIEKTAPTEKWSAAVIAALPPASSLKAAAWAAAGKLGWSSVGWALLGPVVGVFTVLHGHQGELAEARDEAERQGLRRVRSSMLGAIGLFTVGTLAAVWLEQRTLAIGVSLAFTAGFSGIVLLQLLPIQRRRWAARLAAQPSLAAKRRRALWTTVGGTLAGAVMVLAAMLWLVFGGA
jgi:RNA polymerase sigma factor (sigma-70 family)